MKPLFKVDMREVTRLTRAGQLGEALALLRGRPADTPPPESRRNDTIDLVAPTRPGGAWTAAPEPPANGELSSARTQAPDPVASWSMPEPMRALLDRLPGAGAFSEGLHGFEGWGRPAPAPDDARFTERSFSGAAGKRGYKLYVPEGYRGEPVPLVVMLHGCNQNPDDFAAGTRMNVLAEAEVFLVAYPAQSASANVSRCWNWFNAAEQARGRGEPALIAGITQEIMAEYAVDPARVYVAGLSAGGAAAAIMGSAYPDLYAAVGVHSGLACGAARDAASAFQAMNGGGGTVRPNGTALPAIVFHGDRDKTVNVVNGDRVIAQFAAAAPLEATTRTGVGADGSRYTLTRHADASGRVMLEQWSLHGAGHAWSGGSPDGSFTDPAGPDASREMLRFFLEHPKPPRRS
ncbi:PHB depolymerase family esterase [Methylobacterium organophilum]|uniref:extracellular catalytic domain type 1 short-chain-length polyhydroxyalkanoate depolymerase n=1 Tax=Methylobacterium organophilum TaxID=410 RepID=UPI001F13AADD|nr:PHB depolymerase family esterase [Methylobacterium organophilum]UMY17444.1 PHB depolymerase family esterase [Methylobacterium organophilum]